MDSYPWPAGSFFKIVSAARKGRLFFRNGEQSFIQEPRHAPFTRIIP